MDIRNHHYAFGKILPSLPKEALEDKTRILVNNWILILIFSPVSASFADPKGSASSSSYFFPFLSCTVQAQIRTS